MRAILGWSYFAGIQLIMLLATVLGWFLLVPFCLAQAWKPGYLSAFTEDKHIDAWSFEPLNYIYGNPEDGVSGQQALIWTSEGRQVPYMPLPDFLTRFTDIPIRRFLVWIYPAWRAYCWSAWRNSADNLKYVFAWKDGPFTAIGPVKLGWKMENGYNVPVLSL